MAGGNVQRDFISKEDSSSPTASTKSVLLTSVVDASKERDVAIIDVSNVFIQSRVNESNTRVHLRIAGKVVEWLVLNLLLMELEHILIWNILAIYMMVIKLVL